MTYDPNQYLEDHRRTWHDFVKLVAAAAAGVAVLLILLALFVA